MTAAQLSQFEEVLTALLKDIAFTHFMGLEVEAVQPDLILRMPASKTLLGNAEVDGIHGGALASLMETAAILAAAQAHMLAHECTPEIEAFYTNIPVPLNTTTQYLRPCNTKTTYAAAEVLKFGRRSTTVACKLWQDEKSKPCAAMTAILMSAPQKVTV